MSPCYEDIEIFLLTPEKEGVSTFNTILNYNNKRISKSLNRDALPMQGYGYLKPLTPEMFGKAQ